MAQIGDHGRGNDAGKRTVTLKSDERIRQEREEATEAVCDLMAAAEEAALRGDEDEAQRLTCDAERLAFQRGFTFLINLVWLHAPLKS